MLPEPKPYLLETQTLDEFIYPRNKNYPLVESWDNGGKALNNPSDDLTKYAWFAWTDGSNIYLKREDLDDVTIVASDVDITEIDITFDQNMRPSIVYVSEKICKLIWYDTQEAAQVTTVFGEDVRRPRISLDDKRRFATATSDIIFAYQKGSNLHFRLQRERFEIEHTLLTETKSKLLWRIGMGRQNRFLFFWR